jgi:hypothetical protein
LAVRYRNRSWAQERLRVDRHLAAIFDTIVIVHNIWLGIIESSISVGKCVRGRLGNGRTGKSGMTRSMTHLSW